LATTFSRWFFSLVASRATERNASKSRALNKNPFILAQTKIGKRYKSILFEFIILRSLGNYGSGRMDDDAMNWWNE